MDSRLKQAFFLLLIIHAVSALTVISDCAIINNPDEYILSGDILDATNSTCIEINTSDVLLNCQGHRVDGDGSGAYGIYSSEEKNITVANCNVSDFQYGIYFYKVNESVLENNTAHNNSNNGFILYGCSNNNLTGNNAYNNSFGFSIYIDSNNNILTGNNGSNNQWGFYSVYNSNNSFFDNYAYNNTNYSFHFSYSSNNTLLNNSASVNYMGFYLQTGCNNNNLTKNTAYNSSYGGFVISGSYNNFLNNNLAHDNLLGLYLVSSYNSVLINNIIYNQSSYGLYLQFGNNNTLINNTLHDNKIYGLISTNSSNATLINNTVYNTKNGDGFYLYGNLNNNLTDNKAYGNSGRGLFVVSSSFNIFTDNVACNNAYGILFKDSSSNNVLIGNVACNNSEDGINFYNESSNNNLTNNVAYNNTDYGFYVWLNSSNNTLIGNVAYNNSYGFHIYADANNNTLINNVAYNNSQYGYAIRYSSNNNTLINNTAYFNFVDGFAIVVSTDNRLINNSAYDNANSNIQLLNADGNFIFGNNITGVMSLGIVANQSSNNVIANNILYNNRVQLYGVSPSSNNLIYNNIFNVSAGQEIANITDANFWNTTKDCSNRNIIGGLCIGGNYYSNYSGVDYDGDGIGDDPPNYTINLNNIDYLPLTNNYTGCVNLSNPSTYQDKIVNISGTFYVNDNTTLCTDHYYVYVPANTPALRMNVSNIYLDCNGSIIEGSYPNGRGIYVEGLENVTVTACSVRYYSIGFLVKYSNYIGLFNVSAHEEDNNIVFSYTNYSKIEGCNVSRSNGSNDAILIQSGHHNIIYSCLITNSGSNGINVNSSDYNNITNNTASSNGAAGISVLSSYYNTLSNNNLSSNTQRGIYLISSSNNQLINNTVDSNGVFGIDVFSSSDNNVLIENVARWNSKGIIIYRTANNQLINNTVASNGYGIYIYESDGTNSTNLHTFNNSHDIYVGSGISSMAVYLTNLTIDNPFGNFQNYTSLDIIDTMPLDHEYLINWTINQSSLPANRLSFANKWVYITRQAGSDAIDSITWHWLDSELSGYDESKFELWKYNTSGWTMLNNTPDTVNNRLSLTNMNPESTYAILQYNVTNCPVITSPGVYTQTQNYVGAPNDASPFGGFACVKIASSNVVYDCNGYNITNNGTAGTTYGVLLNGSLTNVTVQNCARVSNYTSGVYVYQSNRTVIRNVTVENTSSNGISVYESVNCTILNNSINNVVDYSVYFDYVNFSKIENNEMFNTAGISIDNSVNNVISLNKIINSTYDGIVPWGTGNNTITKNYINNVSQYGIEIGATIGSYISENVIINSTRGIYLQWNTVNVTIANNTINESEYGIYLSSSRGIEIIENNVSLIALDGITLDSSNNSKISNNRMSGVLNGIGLIKGSSGNTITKNEIFNSTSNGDGVYLDKSNNNEVSNNTIYNMNDGSGIHLMNYCFNESINSNSIHDVNLGYGIWLENANSVRINSNVLQSNNFSVYVDQSTNAEINYNFINYSSVGIYLNLASDNKMSNNNITNTGTGVFLDLDLGIGDNYVLNNRILDYKEGILVYSGNGNNISNNFLYHGGRGIILNSSTANTLLNNTVKYTYWEGGIWLYSSSENTLTSNTMNDNEEVGIYLYSSSNNSFVRNAVYNSTNGILISGDSYNNNLTNNTAHGNLIGLKLSENHNNTIIRGDHYYDNALDVNVSTTLGGALLTIVNVVFDRPQGDKALRNYSEISLTDTISTSEQYGLSWSNQPPGALPANYSAVFGKHLRIENYSNANISNIVFHWAAAEGSGYSPSYFVLWKNNGTDWVSSVPSQALDTRARTITVNNLDNFSIFGILQLQAPTGGAGGVGGGGCDKRVVITVTTDCSTNELIINVSTTYGGQVKNKEVQLLGRNINARLTTNERGIATYVLPSSFEPVNYTVRFPTQGEYCMQEEEFSFQSCYPQCDSNDKCPENEYCDNGVCRTVKCDCGEIVNHSCISYECCSDSDCNETSRCVNHRCIPIEINYTLEIEAENITVGENFTLTVLENGVLAEGIEIGAVYPNGIEYEFVSDENGRVIVLAENEGQYLFYVKKTPSVRISAYAHALEVSIPPTPSPPEEKPLPEQPPTPPQKCCLFWICYELFGICWYWWLLLLFLIGTLYYLYRRYSRRRGIERKKEI